LLQAIKTKSKKKIASHTYLSSHFDFLDLSFSFWIPHRVFNQYSKEDLIEWLRANSYADSSNVSIVTRKECENLLHLFAMDPVKDADFFKGIQKLGTRKLFMQNVTTARKEFFVLPSNYWYSIFCYACMFALELIP
jgi:hypothetical protein